MTRILGPGMSTPPSRSPQPRQRNAEVIRQWQILREIESRRTGVTIHELAEMTGRSTRTIRRDLQALQEAGFAIYDEGEENETKRWRIEGSPFKTVQEGLSVADVAALYLSRSVVEGVSGWPLAEELRSAFEKIEQALNPRMRAFLSALPQVLNAKPGPRLSAESAEQITTTRRLFEAVRDRRVVTMSYYSLSSREEKTYRAEPYRLTVAQGGLYLVAWVPAYGQFRTFAIDRIQKLSVLEETFRHRQELPPDVFGHSMGVFTGTPEPVEIEFSPAIAPYVQSRIWHESQQIAPLPDGGVRMTLRVSVDPALRTWVLGFGADARVVAPRSLADAIADECRRILDSRDNPAPSRHV
jgi:predicted DNA-binding transcriptional regulator YafY